MQLRIQNHTRRETNQNSLVGIEDGDGVLRDYRISLGYEVRIVCDNWERCRLQYCIRPGFSIIRREAKHSVYVAGAPMCDQKRMDSSMEKPRGHIDH